MYQYLIIDSITGAVVYLSGHYYHTALDAYDCGSYDVQEHYNSSSNYIVDVPTIN